MDAQLKQDIQDCIKKVLTVFTTKYTKEYMLAMVRMIEQEVDAEPTDWQLLERPESECADALTGWLKKESNHLKKWNPRYMIFRPNFTVDYYTEEANVEKGKLRGTFNLCGYSVIEDVNNGILLRLKRLAEKMGVDFSNLPKPKEYPPLTFELHHDRRQCYYLQASSEEEFNKFVKQFRHAIWNARGLSWDDELHQVAFPLALRKTRWELGRWDSWWNSGSEEQLLCEMIADELEYDIMGRIYAKLPSFAPWFIRNKIRKTTQSTIDGVVMAAVKPAWAAMRKTVEELRPKVEPKVRESVTPLFEAKKGIMDKMRSGVMSVIEPLLVEHVNPHLGKIVTIIKSPMTEAFEECIRLWQEKVDKWEAKEDRKASFYELDWLGRSYWELRTALNKLDVMYDPLWLLQEIFPQIWPWHYIWKGHSRIYKLTDNAVYTFEKGIDEKGDKDVVRRDTLLKFKHDTDLAAMHWYAHILKAIILPPFEKLLHPAAKHIIEPLADLVPDPLKEFLDINQMFEDLYNKVLDDSINVVLRADGSGETSRDGASVSHSSSSSSAVAAEPFSSTAVEVN